MPINLLIIKTYWYFRRWGLRAVARRIFSEMRLRWHRHLKRTPQMGRMVGRAHFPDLVNLAAVAPLGGESLNERIAVHAHIFYLDLAEEVAAYLYHVPFAFDLFISTTHEQAQFTCEQIFGRLRSVKRLEVRIAPNRGRDIAPFFCLFGAELANYDFLAHIHTKKSLHADGCMAGWREYLLRQLLGSEDQVRRIFALFKTDLNLGMVYPQSYRQFPYWGNTWLSNKPLGREWCRRLKIKEMPESYFDYPAGSMFWARTAGLRALFDAGITLTDFPEEAGQNDGTFAHCIERLLALVTRQAGLQVGILSDESLPSWSKWRFDHYLARTRDHVETLLMSGRVKVIAFDIFDTLVMRPLIHPESIKRMIAVQVVDMPGGADFIRLRPIAEQAARTHKGQDVHLNDIYREYATLAGLSIEEAEAISLREEHLEEALITARPDGLALFRSALTTGKPVVLISDMFLCRQTIERILQRQGIRGYTDLYLSSDVGLRKDSGQLYRYVLEQRKLMPDSMLMIGDNEHSDLQIPMDMGIHTCHVLRSADIADATPRFSRILERFRHSDDLSEQLTLGLIIQRFFHTVFYEDFNPVDFIRGGAEGIGYAIAGPVILAFSQWLLAQAKADGITTLYFLAREGQILKEVYDRLASVTSGAAAAQYLVVSRRAMTVPLVETFDDIQNIARADYFPNSLKEFLFYRFGISLSDAELAQGDLWSDDRKVEIKNGNLNGLQALLEAFADRIKEHATLERPGLLAYLQQMGLDHSATSAVVDVGYSATIQGHLSRALGKNIHGYYLLTSAKAKQVCKSYDVWAKGFYGELLTAGTDKISLWRRSFELEMLLSSDEAQVMCYETQPDGTVAPVFQLLSPEEQSSTAIRADIRRGTLAFVNDFLALGQTVSPKLTASRDLAVALYEEFVDHLSAAEWNTMASFVLDDHYCGRGLVTLEQPDAGG